MARARTPVAIRRFRAVLLCALPARSRVGVGEGAALADIVETRGAVGVLSGEAALLAVAAVLLVVAAILAATADALLGGAGLGLRYATAIGPIRLDLAVPVGGSTGDGLQIYLGLGQAF